MKQQFTVARLTQPEELRKLFALRYQVFRSSDEAIGFAPENPFAMTIDTYDPRSEHFGLFRSNGHDTELLGGMRMCYADDRMYNAFVPALCNGCPDLVTAVSTDARELPFLSYSHLTPEARTWYDRLDHRTLVEPGRFFIESSARHCGLGLFMLRAITAIGHFHFGLQTAIVGASNAMIRMYLKFGFVRMPAMHDVSTNGVNYTLLVLKPDALPSSHRRALMQKAEAYERNGYVTWEANAIEFTPNRLKKTA